MKDTLIIIVIIIILSYLYKLWDERGLVNVNIKNTEMVNVPIADKDGDIIGGIYRPKK